MRDSEPPFSPSARSPLHGREICAWIDASKTKIGYEINFNPYFYKYTPPGAEMASTLSRKFNWSHFEEIIYRRWPDKYEHKAYEDTPLGIILCAGKNSEQEELLALGQAGIHVAECLPFLY